MENRYEDDAVRRLRRERRRREMRRRKRRRAMIKKMILSGMLALTAAVALAVWISRGKEGDSFGKGTMPQAVREVLAAAAADRQAAREEQEQ